MPNGSEPSISTPSRYGGRCPALARPKACAASAIFLATLAVTRRMVCHLLEAKRGQRDYMPTRISLALLQPEGPS
jgi:hypothetical protein